MTWVDARLEFYNIKVNETKNIISIDELSRIWLPVIIFHNTERGQRSKNDEESFATINRLGEGKGSDSSISEDIDIYKGSENTISISRIYNTEFFCDYDMRWFSIFQFPQLSMYIDNFSRWYPFDTQTCFMILRLGGGTELLVSLTPGPLNYSGPEELTQYYVKKYLIGEISLENSKGLSISITFGRRLLGAILTVYLPTVLLNVIGHATNFFKPFFFEAVVTVNLTGDNFDLINLNFSLAMLVLTTMFINVSNNLPKTSYVKMIDIWLIFNLLLPFIEVLVHTYMDTLRYFKRIFQKLSLLSSGLTRIVRSTIMVDL